MPGSGLLVGGGPGGSQTLRAPFFIDTSLRTWSDEQADMLLGGSLRLELENGSSAAIVPRAELRHRMGPLELRPGVALPLYFVPFSLFGVETGISLRGPTRSRFGLLAMLGLGVFFLGSDLPDDSAVVFFHGGLGVELQI